MIMKPVKIRDLVLGRGQPKICIPIVGEDEKEILAQALRIRSYPCDLVEFRADWYEEVFDRDRHTHLLCDLREALGELPILYTFRTKAEGGGREITYDSYRDLLLSVSRSRMADLIDVEGFFRNTIPDLVQEIHAQGVPVILSWHDFDKTEDEDQLISRMKALQDMGADLVKIAVMPRYKEDVRTLMAATWIMAEQFARVPLVTMAMSDIGRISRVCGEWTGSCMTFGSAGQSSAPGQLDAADLKGLLNLFHVPDA